MHQTEPSQAKQSKAKQSGGIGTGTGTGTGTDPGKVQECKDSKIKAWQKRLLVLNFKVKK